MGLKNSKTIKSVAKDSVNTHNPPNILNKYQFKEIIVFENFEIDDGVLGFERDVYLSIVKFLDSSILRKV
jgi:hypothetical protein